MSADPSSRGILGFAPLSPDVVPPRFLDEPVLSLNLIAKLGLLVSLSAWLIGMAACDQGSLGTYKGTETTSPTSESETETESESESSTTDESSSSTSTSTSTSTGTSTGTGTGTGTDTDAGTDTGTDTDSGTGSSGSTTGA